MLLGRQFAKVDKVVTLHEFKIPVRENHGGKLGRVPTIHLESQRVHLDQLGDCLKEQNEDRFDAFFDGCLRGLGSKKVGHAET